MDMWKKTADLKSPETARSVLAGVAVQLVWMMIVSAVFGLMELYALVFIAFFATCVPTAMLFARFAATIGKSKLMAAAMLLPFAAVGWFVTGLMLVATESDSPRIDVPPGPSRFERTKEKAESGDADAQCLLAEFYFDGDHVDQDFAKAREWLEKAAGTGHAVALMNLGRMHCEGLGGPTNLVEGARCIGKAANAGLAEAQWRIGNMYLIGDGVKQNDRKAVSFISKAADQGYINAQKELSAFYMAGRAGVGQDMAKAAEWLEKAANKGDVDAKWDLACLMDNCMSDFAGAAKWYRECAYGKHGVEACCRLAEMHVHGKGVRRSAKAAIEWFERAAGRGDLDAMYNIGALYCNGGDDIEPDEKMARKWLEKAAGRGHVMAKELLSALD